MSAAKTNALADKTAQCIEKQEIERAEQCSSASEDSKSFATLQAQFALKGFALMRLADGVLLAERWGCFRQLDTQSQADQFLQQIGGSNGRT